MATRRKPAAKHKALLDMHRHNYEYMLYMQAGVCGICGREPSPRRKFDLDHDHRLMYIRGLLCHRCNRAIPTWMTAKWLYDAGDFINAGPFVLEDGSIMTLTKEST